MATIHSKKIIDYRIEYMKNIRISLIAAFYKDLTALGLIIDSLKKQNYNNFELIVAEDNDTPATREFLGTIKDIDIIHTSQPDQGIQKARSLNNAILACTGDYLVFIDADCILCKNFLQAHASLAETGKVLSGRRVNLGPRMSNLLRSRKLNIQTIERHYLLFAPLLLLDRSTHIDQGLTFNPQGWFYQQVIAKRKKSNLSLLGCNYSCFKKDMIEIDGYDECYGETAVADDTDLQWRFALLGVKMKSCKMAANVYHLHHGRSHRIMSSDKEVALMKARKQAGDYHALIGLKSHQL
jgi:cellulose synthase/poly-beta-1,6-N-acetylglucosamine synthase-like glycosyltransferase